MKKNPKYDKNIFTLISAPKCTFSEVNLHIQIKPLEVDITFGHKDLSRTEEKIIYLVMLI